MNAGMSVAIRSQMLIVISLFGVPCLAARMRPGLGVFIFVCFFRKTSHDGQALSRKYAPILSAIFKIFSKRNKKKTIPQSLTHSEVGSDVTGGL